MRSIVLTSVFVALAVVVTAHGKPAEESDAARVRAEVYNLEGEAVAASAWRDVPAVEPFVVEVDVDIAVTGLYLCRLVVETDGSARDQSVVQMAIVR